MSETYFAKSMVMALGFDSILPIQEIDAMAAQQLPAFSLYCRKKEDKANFHFKVDFIRDGSEMYHVDGYTAALLVNRDFDQVYIGSVSVRDLEEDFKQLPWNERYAGDARTRLDAWNNLYAAIEKLVWIISSPSHEDRLIGIYLALNYLPLSMLGSFYITRDVFTVLPKDMLIHVDFSGATAYYPVDKATSELYSRLDTQEKKSLFRFFK
ncbi:hypothetical protein [Filimonas effusa]|uniref:Uncharacterized protein n=1 Tax=Filimonas effusa TaxID=2508721 RepID=A0A4V1M9L9_9BACT|nr:hypothetical protein [Filimonas effusa]RXK81670.1 hypothetical protein ESB13_17885 [Filimonas effusa]